MSLRAFELLAVVAFTGVALAAPDDRRAPSTRALGGASATHVRLASGLPKFALFGWVSPPADSTNAARIGELAGAGLNLTMPPWEDLGRTADNLFRLDLDAANGIRGLVFDERFERFLTLDVNSPQGGALLDSIVSTYKDHPGFAGYYLGDEPPADQFELLGKLHRALRQRDPEHPAWNDLTTYYAFATREEWLSNMRAYLDSTGAAVLCDNEYDFQNSGDRGHFVDNAATLATLARERGIPFWAIVQLIAHLEYRPLSDAELRWQVSTLLAYGARGIGYFTYWTPAQNPIFNWQEGMIGWDGLRTHWYATVATLNEKVLPVGAILADLTRLATKHAGSVPIGAVGFTPDPWVLEVTGRAMLGEFADSTGMRYLVVVNPDSASARTIDLTFPFTGSVERFDEVSGLWYAPASGGLDSRGFALALDLDAGEFALLRLTGEWNTLPSSRGPALRLAPNPANGRVTLAIGNVGARGRIEILDAGGRRVWSRSLASGSSAHEWRGERDQGGAARAGLYFVRTEDVRGVTVARLTWLGAR
jgi:hypothetical protein